MSMPSHPLFLLVFAIGFSTTASAATLEVSTLNDSGPGSLRQALTDANAAPGVDVISFASGLSGTIALASSLPAIDDALMITGPGPAELAISGNASHGIFTVETGVIAEISGLTLTAGARGFGGAIANAGELTVSDCIIESSTAQFSGGAIDNFEGSVTLIASTISGNSAEFGGGLSNVDGSMEIRDSRIEDNLADFGGGIDNEGSLLLEASTLSGNQAMLGAGLENLGVAVLFNATVSGNIADDDGAGIDNFGGDVDLLFATIAGNTAGGAGGGVWHGGEGTLRVRNSLIALSSGGDCLVDGDALLIASGDNLDTDSTCPGLDTVTPTALALQALADNGGATPTRALASDSAAVDRASECTDFDGTTAIAVDQRGQSRPAGGACDSGAFESQPDAQPALALDPGSLDFGDLPLGEPSAAAGVAVSNVGGGMLDLLALSIQGIHAGDFALMVDDCSGTSLAPAAGCTAEIIFTASAAGVRQARLRIPSNAADSPHFVALSGSHDVIFHDGF